MKFDDLLKYHVGEYGRYQKVMTFLILFIDFFNTPNTIELNFTTYTPDFYCIDIAPQDGQSTRTDTLRDAATTAVSVLPTVLGDTAGEWSSGPPGNGTCYVFDEKITDHTNMSDADQIPCEHWTYSKTVRTSTIVTQFDLVCSRKLLVATTRMLYMIGFLLGVSFGGLISDRFGRRITIFIAFCIRISARIIGAFSVSYGMHAVTKLFVGWGHSATSLSAYILATELVGPSKRPLILILYHLNWSSGYALLTPGVAYFIRDWRHTEIAFTALQVPVVLLFLIMPESPRWLLARGRIGEANAVLRKIARWNGRDAPPECTELNPDEEHEGAPQKETWSDILKSREIIIRSSILFITWFSISALYYGLAFGVDRMAGDLYLNVFIFGVVEYPAYLLIVLVNTRLGRKWPIFTSILLSSLIMLASMLVPQNKMLVATILSMLGKGFNTFAFGAIYLYSAELYPTTVRSTGIGMCSTMARVGGMVAPFMGEMGQYAPLVFGALCFLSAILLAMLPETRNKPLPQSIDEVQEIRSGFRCQSMSK